MKPKTGKELEEELDKEFKKMDIKPRVYHFRDIVPFSAITVVIDNNIQSWDNIVDYINNCNESATYSHNHATRLLQNLMNCDIHGVAICDNHDQFSRQEGRNWAKRRLLRHLKNVGEQK